MSIDLFLKKITNIPNWINWPLLYLNIFREHTYGSSYKRFKKNLNNQFSIEKNLVEITNLSIRNVPYYRNKYSFIYSMNEFKDKIGFIEKNSVLSCFELFIADNINMSDFIEGTTGGTSGKPLRLIIPKNRYVVELAMVHSLWNRIGWNYHTRGVIRNHKLKDNQIYKINPITKEVIFDAFRLNNEYAKKIYYVLKKHNVKFIQAYPSSAYLFCKLCKDQELDLSFLSGFLTSSEPVLDFQKDLIENQLGLKLFSFYGHSEKLAIGGYCEKTTDTHFEPKYGFTELIDEFGNEIKEIGKVGEIVGTTFHNLGMPLIRYKTGDFAEYVGHECEKCGRAGLIVRNIQGRWDKNIIFKSDGTFTTTTALNLHNYLYKYIDGLQYIQEIKGQLIVLLIKNCLFKDEYYNEFYDHFKNAMGHNNEVEIRFVDKLIQQPNGKFLVLISNLDF